MTKFYILLLTLFAVSFANANHDRVRYYSCSDYKNINADQSCSSEFNGLQEDICEVCREGESCFMALNNKLQRGLCQAYIEGKSCFMALNNSDRHWCQVIAEGGSCGDLRSDVDRFRCEHNEFPSRHTFWIY